MPVDIEALARLRSVTQSADELCITPREGLATLQKFPGAAAQSASADKRKLRLAVTPAFVREHGPFRTAEDLEGESLLRLGNNAVFGRSIPSPHAHYLCWRTCSMDRWECAAFADWLRKSLG